MRLPPGTRRLSSPRELEAVTSPVRQEVLEHLKQAGASSVADLARWMGRRPTALHYHVKLLLGAGLLRRAGRKPSGSRSEALYALAAPRFAVVGAGASPLLLRSAVRTLGATLRLTQREAARALLSGGAVGAGPGRDFHARRHRASLSPRSLAKVNRLLERLESLFAAEAKRARRPGEGKVVSLTLVLTPSRHRGPGRSQVST